MSDDLRQRYADAVLSVLDEWARNPGDKGQLVGRMAHAVMAVRDEEVERLREAIADLDSLISDERAIHERTIERAVLAERRLAAIRRYIDEDFRFWCSPHGVAGRYARDLIDYLDRLDGQEDDRG